MNPPLMSLPVLTKEFFARPVLFFCGSCLAHVVELNCLKHDVMPRHNVFKIAKSTDQLCMAQRCSFVRMTDSSPSVDAK